MAERTRELGPIPLALVYARVPPPFVPRFPPSPGNWVRRSNRRWKAPVGEPETSKTPSSLGYRAKRLNTDRLGHLPSSRCFESPLPSAPPSFVSRKPAERFLETRATNSFLLVTKQRSRFSATEASVTRFRGLSYGHFAFRISRALISVGPLRTRNYEDFVVSRIVGQQRRLRFDVSPIKTRTELGVGEFQRKRSFGGIFFIRHPWGELYFWKIRDQESLIVYRLESPRDFVPMKQRNLERDLWKFNEVENQEVSQSRENQR